MTERDMLEKLYQFLCARNYVFGDEQGVKDMVLRYKQPPLTMHHRIAMQMTVQDYNDLSEMLKKILEHFNPDTIPQEVIQ